jgi:hypothetical protein
VTNIPVDSNEATPPLVLIAIDAPLMGSSEKDRQHLELLDELQEIVLNYSPVKTVMCGDPNTLVHSSSPEAIDLKLSDFYKVNNIVLAEDNPVGPTYRKQGAPEGHKLTIFWPQMRTL